MVFFNNWRTREEFRVIEITFKFFDDTKQGCLCLSLLGFGVVIIINNK